MRLLWACICVSSMDTLIKIPKFRVAMAIWHTLNKAFHTPIGLEYPAYSVMVPTVILN